MINFTETAMELSDILYLIDEVPAQKREGFLSYMGQTIGDIKAYHVTSAANAEQIKAQGFKAQSSRQSYDRPAAVYFFLDASEINNDNKAILLDNPQDAVVIEVVIPRNEFLAKSKWDGLYNTSFDISRSAIQFFGDVPASWII